eukprot:1977677-Pleurochrysis_carterae.AAC.2
MLPNEQFLGRSGLLRPGSCKRKPLVRQARDVAGAEASRNEASTGPSEALRPRKRCTARSWHLATAGREALAAVNCCLVQRCCRSCMSAKRGATSPEAPRADAKVRSKNHGTGRAGTATNGKDRRVDEGERV